MKIFWLVISLIILTSCSSQPVELSASETAISIPATTMPALPSQQETANTMPVVQEAEPNDKDLWQHFSTKLTLANTHPESIQDSLQWYQRNASIFKHSEERMRYFLFFILDELDKQNLPADIALIPIIESQYNPQARGNGTAGMWQFTAGTARNFKLVSNNGYDGRLDPIASTKAATHYMRYLLDYFNNDLLLAFAAYNAGEGTVSKAMRRNLVRGLPTDFWSISLPAHTRSYVMRIIALATIFHSPNESPLRYSPVANAPIFTTMTIKSGISAEEIYHTVGMTAAEFRLLNAGLKNIPFIASNELSIQILTDTSAEKKSALNSLPRHAFLLPRTYQVKKGDTLSGIAKKFHTSINELKRLNKLKNDNIRMNQTLIVAIILKQ